jgi:hypothetical protein
MTAQHLDCLWLFEIRKPSLRGAKRSEAIYPLLSLRGAMDCFAALAMTVSSPVVIWLFED